MIKITKMDAGKAQLREAIIMFYEDRDPVSIHTLIGAALEIFNDHIQDKGAVWDNKLFFHPETIYIKNEHKKDFQAHIRKHRNFFKHADRDIKAGIHEIDFDPGLNEIYIFETIRALAAIEPKFKTVETEFFTFWMIEKNPSFVDEIGLQIGNIARKHGLTSKAEYLDAIKTININYPNYSDFLSSIKNTSLKPRA